MLASFRISGSGNVLEIADIFAAVHTFDNERIDRLQGQISDFPRPFQETQLAIAVRLGSAVKCDPMCDRWDIAAFGEFSGSWAHSTRKSSSGFWDSAVVGFSAFQEPFFLFTTKYGKPSPRECRHFAARWTEAKKIEGVEPHQNWMLPSSSPARTMAKHKSCSALALVTARPDASTKEATNRPSRAPCSTIKAL